MDCYREEEEEEYEEEGANRLFGFMFGNLDDSGDLDADYLDDDAKEHLAAVADKIGGTSFRDMHLSAETRSDDAADQEVYDEKAEDAVDYEDMDEQYEGPEVRAGATEEDYLSKLVPVTAFGNTDSLYDDENYDEDDDEPVPTSPGLGEDVDEDEDDLAKAFEDELEAELLDDDQPVPPSPGLGENIGEDEGDLEAMAFEEELEAELLAAEISDFEEETRGKTSIDSSDSTPLPILCVEDGTVILRFSQLFALQQPVKKDRKYPSHKESSKTKMRTQVNVEEDEEVFFRESSTNIFGVREEAQVIEDYYFSTPTDYSDSRQFGASDAFQCSEPTLGFCSELHLIDQLNWEDDIQWDNDLSIAESLENSGSKSLEFGADPRKAFHPQLLRLESELIQDNPSHVNKMMLQNRDLVDGSWMDNIVWEPDQPVTKPKLILDLQDEQMLFEIQDTEENKHLMLHAGAMITTKAAAGESTKGPCEGGFNISNDAYYVNCKPSQQVIAKAKKRAPVPKVLQKKKNDVGPNKQKQKKNDSEREELRNKKVKTKSDGIKNVKANKSSARDSFSCGACGKPNHTRTNKLCPGKSNSLEPKRKLINKGALKFSVVKAHEDDDKLNPKGMILKFKCGGSTKVKKTKPEVVESQKPSLFFKPPSEDKPRNKIRIRVAKEETTNFDKHFAEQDKERLAEIRLFEEVMRMDAAEEEREKKKRKKNPEIRDDDYLARMIPERRVKRKVAPDSVSSGQATKRRLGGRTTCWAEAS